MSDYSDAVSNAMRQMKHLFGASNYDLVDVKSSLDGKVYKVRNLPDRQRAADLMAEIRLRMNKLKMHCESKFPDKPQVKRLRRNFKAEPTRFSESTPDEDFTSYSVNKGESVHFCLRQRENGNEDIMESNVMTFVAIHELGHLMTKSVGHEPEFWNSFKLLLKIAIDNGIYKNIDFNNTPKDYCGVKITDTPLKLKAENDNSGNAPL